MESPKNGKACEDVTKKILKSEHIPKQMNKETNCCYPELDKCGSSRGTLTVGTNKLLRYSFKEH